MYLEITNRGSGIGVEYKARGACGGYWALRCRPGFDAAGRVPFWLMKASL